MDDCKFKLIDRLRLENTRSIICRHGSDKSAIRCKVFESGSIDQQVALIIAFFSLSIRESEMKLLATTAMMLGLQQLIGRTADGCVYSMLWFDARLLGIIVVNVKVVLVTAAAVAATAAAAAVADDW